MKQRVEQIKRIDEQLRKQKESNMRRLHANPDQDENEGGISWGMGFDEEDEIAAYQKNLEEDESDDESREGLSDDEGLGDDDENQLLDIEKIKMREGLTDK